MRESRSSRRKGATPFDALAPHSQRETPSQAYIWQPIRADWGEKEPKVEDLAKKRTRRTKCGARGDDAERVRLFCACHRGGRSARTEMRRRLRRDAPQASLANAPAIFGWREDRAQAPRRGRVRRAHVRPWPDRPGCGASRRWRSLVGAQGPCRNRRWRDLARRWRR